MALTEQQIKDYYKTQGTSATPLSPAQYEAISVSDLNKSQAPVNVPPPPVPTPVPMAGIQATIDANAKVLTGNVTTPSGAVIDSATGKVVTPPPEKPVDTTTGGVAALFAKYFPKPPESTVDTYKTLSEEAGIAAKETELQAKQQAVKESQSKLATINAKIAGISAQSQADVLALEGQGRGITKDILTRQAQETSRQYAIRALPIQAEALAAQAEVASAQGDATLASSILEQAQGHLDTIFGIHKTDAENQYKYQVDLFNTVYDIATKDQQKQLDAKKEITTKNQTAKTDALNNAQSISATALSNGQANIASQISALIPPDINSKTFEEDLQKYNAKVAGLQGQVKPDEAKQLQIQKLRLENQKLIDEIENKSGTAASEDLYAYAAQYADTGKLPSPAELKLSGLNVGQVTTIAKQLPKPNGAIVSTNTGTKSQSLSPTQEASYIAMNEIVNQTIPSLKDRFGKISTGIVGGLGGLVYTSQDKQDYLSFRQEFLSKLLVARSGAAVTEQEYARYSKLLPTTFNQPFFLGGDGAKKLNSLETSMKTNLDNILNTQQLSIYGYSKVNVNGVQRTVGEILDIGGTQYKVLPDGTLTDII